MEDVLSIIRENSKLLEATTSGDIASTQDLLGSMIDSKYNDSLVYQICEVLPMKSTVGKVFTARQKPGTNDMEVISKEINTKISTYKTGFTQEVLQDMNSMFGRSTKRSIRNVIKGVSAKEENKSLLTLLFDESTTKSSYTVTDSDSLESVMLQISKKVSESVIEMNRETYKTLDSFCILTKEFAASFLGSFNYMTEGNEKSLYVGRMGRTDYYINPFPNTSSQFTDAYDYAYESDASAEIDYCYVGLRSKTAGASSVIFAPFNYEGQYVTDPDTLEVNLFVRNRYGIVSSPLHKPLEGTSMLHKFQLIKG